MLQNEQFATNLPVDNVTLYQPFLSVDQLDLGLRLPDANQGRGVLPSAQQAGISRERSPQFENWLNDEIASRAAAEVAEIGIWQFAVSTGELKFDRNAARLLNLNPPLQILSICDLFRHVHPEEQQDLRLRFDLCCRAGVPVSRKFRHTGEGANERLLKLTASRRRLSNGQLILVGALLDCTEELRTLDALAISQNRLEVVFNQTLVGVLHRDDANNVLMVNDRYLELVGRTEQELSGLSFEAFTHPEDQDWNSRLFHQKKTTGEPFTAIKRYVRPDGRVRTCEVHVSFVRDADGGSTSTLVFAHDISARILAEQEQNSAREMLAFALEGAGAGTWEADLCEGGHLKLSLDAARICGLPEGHSGQLAYRDLVTLIDPFNFKELEGQLPAVLASGLPSVAELKISQPDGRERWLRVHGRANVGNTGEPTKIVGLVFDHSHRKLANDKLRESEMSLRLTQEATEIGTFVAEVGGATTGSAQFFRNLGLPPDTVCIAEEERIRLLHPDDQPRVAEEVLRALECDVDFIEAEYRIVRADNQQVRWMLVRIKPQRDPAGRVVQLLGAHLDITESKTAAMKLRETQTLNQGIVESSTDCIKILDVDGTLRFISSTGVTALDVDDPTSLLNTRWQELWPAEAQSLVEEALIVASSGGVGRFNSGCISLKGNPKWLDVVVTALRDEMGCVNQLLAITRDVTQLHEQTEKVRWAAEHDALTELPNRNFFDARLKDVLDEATSTGETVGLIALDVDNFKQVNDAFGHDAGDQLLKVLAGRVSDLIDEGDFAVRLGGDEFAVVYRHLENGRDILKLAYAISDGLKQPVVYRNHILDCRVSVGAATFPKHGSTCEPLLKSADIALYAAKRRKGSNILLFERSLRADLDSRTTMIGLAKSALDRREIVPFYQPKVCLRTGAIKGFEALLRWRDLSGVVRSPAEIDAAFEDYDLAHEISERMQECVLQDIRTWLDQGLDFGHVALNAAAAEFSRNDFAARLLGKLERAGVSGRHLQVEVTETVFMGRGADHVGSALSTLKASGVDISLDDFGTGYASLSHLKNFPVDTIKIDRSFITELTTNSGDTAIVCALLNLASDLNMKVVAEGIETEEQANFLRERNCDLGQGFFFGKAISAASVSAAVLGSSLPG